MTKEHDTKLEGSIIDPSYRQCLIFLTEQIDFNIEKIKPKVKGNKDKTSAINLSTVALSALITLTLALEIKEFEIIQKNIALVLGALLTVFNGWTLLFDYKKLWVRQKKTLLSLYQIKNEIGYLQAKGKDEIKSLDTLFDRYLELWERDSTEWITIHKVFNKTTTK
jgi:hypothetical protein